MGELCGLCLEALVSSVTPTHCVVIADFAKCLSLLLIETIIRLSAMLYCDTHISYSSHN